MDKEKEIIDLNDKVNEFINWYFENMIKGNYTKIGEYQLPQNIKNLIEKIAVWYELRYPEYEINRLMYCCGQENLNIDNIMFKNNLYIKKLSNEDFNIKELNWANFYNSSTFFKSLPFEESCLFLRPSYQNINYLIPTKRAPFNLYLTDEGVIIKAENITNWTNNAIKDEELVGLHVIDLVKLFKSKNIKLPENSILEEIINQFQNENYRREGILNCAMYRIIERGGNRIGPRRAFLFAKEFARNIDIPMKYAIDERDPGLRLFINEYLKLGGSKELKCYIGYFERTNKEQKLDTISIQELLLKQNMPQNFYISEEHKLKRLAMQ